VLLARDASDEFVADNRISMKSSGAAFAGTSRANDGVADSPG